MKQPWHVTALALVASCGSSTSAGTSTPDSGVGVVDASVDSATPEASGADAASDPWACIGNVSYPTPTTSTVHLHYLAFDPISNKGVPGVQVRACPDATDSSCSGSVDVQMTGADGTCNFVLPAGSVGFNGYFEATLTGDITLLNFVMPPIWSDRPDYQRIQWTGPLLQSLASTAVGVTLNPNRGEIGIEAHNCLSHDLQGVLDVRPETLAVGATFELEPPDPEAKFFYLHGNAFQSTDPKTDAEGTAAILNVAPGAYTLTMKLASTGQRIGSARLSIRPGVYSMFAFFPSP